MSVIEHWGSTPAERAETFPCDGLLEEPDHILFRAVDVDAPAAVVFRWLCQLRVAPYSYDLIDNFGRRSPRQLIPGLEQLEVGQTVATIFELAAFEPGTSLTLRSDTRRFGRIAVTYRVRPTGPGSSRLVVKLVVARRPGLLGVFMRRVLPAGDLVMMRKQLLNLKHLAEREARA